MRAQLELDGTAPLQTDTTGRRVLLAYGGGVDSVAAALLLASNGVRFTAVMTDPGSEWRSTHDHRERVMNPWLIERGLEPVVLIDRITEGQGRPRTWRLETLYDECMRIHSLPSIAYGFKKCSQKYKGDTTRWWIAKQPWAIEEWSAGRKILRVFGYNADEPQRAKGFLNGWEAERFDPWYPLIEAQMGRDECIECILGHGMEVPDLSACTHCPSNSIDDWRRLHRVEPDSFAKAVAMSRNAQLENPDVVGLMRCAPHGKRQLHVWVDEGMPTIRGEVECIKDCECAT